MPDLRTENFLNVEILKTGTWHGKNGDVTFKVADLDGIVRAAKSSGVTVPIKIGHNDSQKLLTDDEPSAGWVENVRRQGNTLLADFMKVPGKLADLIKAGTYRGRSVEIVNDFETGGKTFPMLLSAVSLLGATPPAVSGLADIVKLFSEQHLELPEEDNNDVFLFEQKEGFANELTLEDVLSGLDSWLSSSERFIRTKRGAPTIRQLVRALKEGIQRASKGDSKLMLSKATLEKLGLTETATEEEIEAAIADKLDHSNDDDPDKDKDKDKDKEGENEELSAMNKEILDLKGKLATRDAQAAVEAAINEGKLLPAQRESAVKMALRDASEFEAFIKTQPKVIELGERGRDTDAPDFSKYEPNEATVASAKSMNVWTPEYRVQLMRQAASADGVEIPDSFFGIKDNDKDKAS